MPDIRCPNCRTLTKVVSSAFGVPFECSSCGQQFVLDTLHLARYRLPSLIEVLLVDSDGAPFQRAGIPLFIEHGYPLPPIGSDSMGRVRVDREIFLQAHKDHAEAGLMDHPGDFAIGRHIRIRVPNADEAKAAAVSRYRSGWPIQPLEQKLYGDMATLLAAYEPSEDVGPADALIDLAAEQEIVRFRLTLPRAQSY
ncbi:MAG: hypothetical protein A2139_04400 [Desulfobacca sp. RBG_16_60_12]|nr:MAG: hypothetical protein A2139_04400 [Desulfobacca sp. RBG_16_60_12]